MLFSGVCLCVGCGVQHNPGDRVTVQNQTKMNITRFSHVGGGLLPERCVLSSVILNRNTREG